MIEKRLIDAAIKKSQRVNLTGRKGRLFHVQVVLIF